MLKQLKISNQIVAFAPPTFNKYSPIASFISTSGSGNENTPLWSSSNIITVALAAVPNLTSTLSSFDLCDRYTCCLND